MKSCTENIVVLRLFTGEGEQAFHLETEAYYDHSDRSPCAGFDVPGMGQETLDRDIFIDLGFWLVITLVGCYELAQERPLKYQIDYVPVIFVADLPGRGPRLRMSEERYDETRKREDCGFFMLPCLDSDALVADKPLLHDLGLRVYGLLRWREDTVEKSDGI